MRRSANVLFIVLFLHAVSTLGSSCDNCSCDVTSHTFFWVRPHFDIGTPEFLAMSKPQRSQASNTKHGSSFQATFFGGLSMKSENLGKYFMPYCSNETKIDGNEAATREAIMPQHFNIPSVLFPQPARTMFPLGLSEAYSSLISVNPKQRVIGLGLSYYQTFCWCDTNWWFNASAPLLYVTNSMGLNETNVQGQVVAKPQNATIDQTFFDLMFEALSQDAWQFGKIDNKEHSELRLGFIQVYGGPSYEKECYNLEPFFGITIPTGNTPKARNVFEPIAGNGNHFGFIWGTSTELFLLENAGTHKNLDLSFGVDVIMQYLLSKTQKRSFDLKYKPWSRYIEVYSDFSQAQRAANAANSFDQVFLSSPGINFLTRDVSVRPGFNVSLNLALLFAQQQCDRGFNTELGYNFFAKQAECLTLKEPFSTQAAIKADVGNGITNAVRDMSENALLNQAQLNALLAVSGSNVRSRALALYDNAIIKEQDLDLASAAHPCILSHTIYGSVGYHWDDFCYPLLTSVGGSYEFASRTNTALNRWLIWGKFGVSF